jgi:iron(III) transport system substrate-binding protein
MHASFNRRHFLYASGAAALAHMPVSSWAQSGGVVVYTSNNQQAVQAITDVARKALPNVKFNFITGGSGVLLKRMETEASSAQADIFWSSSANTLGAFKAVFEPYKSPETSKIPAALAHPQNLWAASNIHLVVAMLNLRQLGGNPAPKTWRDLLEPRWKGKIIIADPANSSTAYTILWGVKAMLGSAALGKLAANVVVTPGAANVLRSVAQGEYAVGLTFESNAYAYPAGGQKEIKLLYPEDGTFTTPEFIALAKGAPNGALARRAYDHILSKNVQIALLENAFRRPSRTDIDVSQYADLPNLSSIKVFTLNEEDAAAKRKEFLDEWAALVAAARK